MRPEAGERRGRRRRLETVVLLLVASLTLAPSVALAETPAGANPFSFDTFESLPERLWYVDETERRPPSFSFERNELRAVEAPTRYRTQSILKYTTALGDTGLLLRVKLPLKLRKIVKVELRF